MKYLGIDFGLKNLGLAIAEGPLAEIFGEKHYEVETKVLSFLARLCEEQQVGTIIIGLPEGQLENFVKKFSEKLKKITNLPVIFQDETLSTVEAKQKLIEAGAPRKKRRADHSAAAALILQDFLDTMNYKGGSQNV